jgi:hypothetical protein
MVSKTEMIEDKKMSVPGGTVARWCVGCSSGKLHMLRLRVEIFAF